MTDKEIRFVDTTFRDGHLSLWASGMTTGMMLPVAERMGKAGFEAMELVSGSNFKKAVRELKEDPFERIRRVCELAPDMPFRLIAGRINTFGFDPTCMYRLFIERVRAGGVRQARISDPWNDFDGWKSRVQRATEAGMDSVVNLIFSVSPRHTDEYYAERTRQAATLPVYRLCLKDPGGLLTPERAQTLVPIVLKNAGDKYVELHTHCTTGLGPLVALEGIKLGIRTINTAIPPLANGSSLPSLFNVVANARSLGYTPMIDDESLRPVSDHFNTIAMREGLPIGRPLQYNEAQYRHQVPGGMISNLAHQLKLVGLEDRLDETLEETARVRAELAYPIMVTPLSQFVGSQAAINIVVGERYKEVTDQIINYAMGRYGAEGADEMDSDVKDRILSSARAKELIPWEVPDPSLKEMKRKFGGKGVSDEELILRWITSKEDVDAMHAAGPAQEYMSAEKPIAWLVRELSKRTDLSLVNVTKPGLSLTLRRG